MEIDYFNFETIIATNRREMSQVLDGYWRLNEEDRSWTPPFWPHLRALLNRPYLEERTIGMIRIDAMARRRMPQTLPQGGSATALPSLDLALGSLPVPVATALLLRDTRAPRTAHLALPAARNSEAVLRRLLEVAAELLRPAGIRLLVGPLGLTPYLGGGAQISHWHEPAPLHAPYTPPYLAGLLVRATGQPNGAPEAAGWPVHSRLWRMEVPSEPPPPVGPATLRPLAPERLAGDLLPLLGAATPPGWARPRAQDATFLLEQLGLWPLWGWVAEIGGEPAGFILLQPNVAPALRRLRGGRRLWFRWPRLITRFPTAAGRVLLGAVLPASRGQGIGRQLWQRALGDARDRSWKKIYIGPVAERATATSDVLARWGATAHHRYRLYSSEIM